VSQSFKEDIENAKKAVEETGVKAVEVMVLNTDTILTATELKTRLENKVNQLENRILDAQEKPDATSSTLKGEQAVDATKMILAARKLLLANDLRGALEEVKLATRLVLGEWPSSVTTGTVAVTILKTASSTVTTTPRAPAISAPATTQDLDINIQFITDTTSLDWLEAQIMEQDFTNTDRPPEEKEDTSTIIK